MNLSEKVKREFLIFSQTQDCKQLNKIPIAEHSETIPATKQFTDFIQMIHKMSDQPIKPFKAMKGSFLL